MNKKLLVIAGVISLSGCLQTREDLKSSEEKKVLQTQVTSLQRSNADQSALYQELEEEIRSLNGKVESLENQLSVDHQQVTGTEKDGQQKIADLTNKVNLLTDTVNKQEQELQQALQAITALQQVKAAPVEAASKEKGSFAVAESDFEAKDWNKAILGFEKYRNSNPKGKKYAEATYKMAVCFQELGMKKEAKLFFEEVINKFPDSGDAKKAKFRLKQLK